ncbi:MAG: TolC family protein [Candidatus Methylomirabilales bacterium]
MAAIVASGISLILIVLAPLSAAAQGQPPGEPKKLVISLDEAVKRALEVSPQVKEARAGVDMSRSKQQQAEAAKWAQLEANIFGGPSPESDLARSGGSDGTIKSNSKTSDPVINGAFGRAVITLIQPLYTFGKISAFREAAARGIDVSEAAVDQKASEVALQVKQFYYGYLLAHEIREFVDGIRDELQKALDKAERQVKAGSPAATWVDVYKLRAFRAQVDKGIDEAEEGLTLAKGALRMVLQLDERVEFELADKTLVPVKAEARGVESYIETAKEHRPEFVQLREGIKARKALVDAAAADQYPVFYAAFLADVAQSTNRDFSEVPIITDPLQHAQGGVVLGLKWHFDFGITKGKIHEAEAEYTKLLHKRDFADHGIPLQVRKAHLELQKAQKDMETTKRGYREARRWLVTAVANFDLGIGEARELADALKTYAEMRTDNFRAIYNQRIALANLAFATGEAVRGFSVR